MNLGRRPRTAREQSLTTNHGLSLAAGGLEALAAVAATRNSGKIEIAVTYSKQTVGTKSNRNFFRPARQPLGGPARRKGEPARSSILGLRRRGSPQVARVNERPFATSLRAGKRYRVKTSRLSFSTARADSIAQSPPCAVRASCGPDDSADRTPLRTPPCGVRTLQRTGCLRGSRFRCDTGTRSTTFLIATHANSKIHATHSKRAHITISNRNTILISGIAPLPTRHGWRLRSKSSRRRVRLNWQAGVKELLQQSLHWSESSETPGR